MHPLAKLILLLLWVGEAAAEPALIQAPGMGLVPANQLVVAGNACGPTALLNALRFAGKDWQRAYQMIEGENDKQRIYWLIRERGMRTSKYLTGRPRWSRKGVNIADLCDMANETSASQFLPALRQEVLFCQPRESPQKLLRRTHHMLAVSMRKGFPPVLSLRRYALRMTAEGQQWIILDAHFVTLVSLPSTIDKGANFFEVLYLDPWGGKQYSGRVAIPKRPLLASSPEESPCLEVEFPQTSVGRRLARPGEASVLTLSAALGRW